MKSSQISYFEAHGTGIQASDPRGVASISKVLGETRKGNGIPIGSIKGNIGHLEVVAGIAGLLKVFMIKKGATPPLASHKNINSKLGYLNAQGLRIPRNFEAWNVNFRAAGSNAAALLCQGPYLSSQMIRGPIAQNQEYPISLKCSLEGQLSHGRCCFGQAS